MNRLDAKVFNLNPGDLSINPKYIFDLMGYGPGDAGYFMTDVVLDIQKSATDYIDIQAGFSELVPVDVAAQEDAFYINETRFDCGRIISRYLKRCEKIIFFGTTLGTSFDEWSQSFFKNGDPLNGLVSDSLGSVLAEAAADWVDNKVQDLMREDNYFCTNRFSPGYCGWDVSEQQKLFGCLPENFLNIQLTESSLMLPIKSVSGVIGIGKNVKRMEYSCQICNKKDCYMRRTKEEVIV